jgi:hypothetical protein
MDVGVPGKNILGHSHRTWSQVSLAIDAFRRVSHSQGLLLCAPISTTYLYGSYPSHQQSKQDRIQGYFSNGDSNAKGE